jgi:hypothetical protein
MDSTVAEEHVTPHRNGKQFLAYASITGAHVLSARLSVDYDEPPPNHANILGYPQNREEIMACAQALAAAASLEPI